jgi:alkylated DNA repair dioxygenase AlkB
MNLLFPIEPQYPQGFSYEPGFISMEEEKQLIDTIDGIDLHTFMFQGYEAKRKVASFGWDWSFEHRTLSKGKEIPVEFHFLVAKVAARINTHVNTIAELLVTEYPAGSVINWHRDAPPFDTIAGISLLADCTFRLRPHEEAKRSRRSTISFTAARRSLYIMQGPSRDQWQHSIDPVKHKRYSITLRTLKTTV